VKVRVFEAMTEINRGFQRALDGLAALRQDSAFQTGELDRCAALAKETRAVTNSYLAGSGIPLVP